MSGHIIIERKILEWEWYRNINTCRLFIHMLLKANWKEGKFEGQVIPRGSFVSSISRLASETDLTPREVRTALEHLKATGEVTIKSHNKYSIYKVNNYSLYQSNDIQTDNRMTGKRQASDKQNDIQSDKQATSKRHSNDILTTTIEERKKGRREEVNIKESKRKLGEFSHVLLTQKDIDILMTELGNYKFDKVIKKLDEYIETTGKVYKNHMLVIRKWVIKAVEEENENNRQNAGNTKNQFNAFAQRSYDYAKLEKELIEN